MRPQRGSRAISTMGAKTHLTPAAVASFAATRSDCSINCRIKTAGAGEWKGEDGPISVNYVVTENQRNLKPRLFHRNSLGCVGLFRTVHIQQRTNLALFHPIEHRRFDAGELSELTDLLLHRHLFEQNIDSMLDVLVVRLLRKRKRTKVQRDESEPPVKAQSNHYYASSSRPLSQSAERCSGQVCYWNLYPGLSSQR